MAEIYHRAYRPSDFGEGYQGQAPGRFIKGKVASAADPAREDRILAHRRRVDAELARLGLPPGRGLRVCRCGSEDAGLRLEAIAQGWTQDADGNWVCPQCRINLGDKPCN